MNYIYKNLSGLKIKSSWDVFGQLLWSIFYLLIFHFPKFTSPQSLNTMIFWGLISRIMFFGDFLVVIAISNIVLWISIIFLTNFQQSDYLLLIFYSQKCVIINNKITLQAHSKIHIFIIQALMQYTY